MSLIRFGNRLIIKNDALTCNTENCCDDDPPDECWCPNWCPYYWQHSGYGGMAGGTLMLPPWGCLFPSPNFDRKEFAEFYELGSLIRNAGFPLKEYTIFVGLPGISGSWDLAVGFSSRGSVELQHPDIDDFDVVTYLSIVQINVLCARNSIEERAVDFDEEEQTNIFATTGFFIISATLFEYAVANGTTRQLSPVILYQRQAKIELAAVACSCISGSPFYCIGQEPFTGQCHTTGDVEISWDEDGVSIGEETFRPWQNEYTPIETLPDYYRSSPGSARPFPSLGSFTLKRNAFCPGECDCTRSKSGIIVFFANEQFVSDTNTFIGAVEPNGTTWSHVAGSGKFSRADYNECGTLAVLTEAELVCESVDGIDEYFVVFTRTCTVFADTGCPRASTGFRTAEWIGKLSCDPDGRPTGQSFDVQLVSDTINEEPEIDCDVGDTPGIFITPP